MCTAISDVGIYHFFGRTLDVEEQTLPKVVIAPRRFAFRFVYEGEVTEHPSVMGAAHISEGVPLFYDGVNEAGLCAAALSFQDNAVYFEPKEKGRNLASFEVVSYILATAKNVCEAKSALEGVTVTNDSFGESLPNTPLHWLIADRREAICVEQTERGLKIYDNPFGVLTNNPSFPYHREHLRELLHVSTVSPENRIFPSVCMKPYSFGTGAIGLPGDFSSASRFVRATFAKAHTTDMAESYGDVSRFFHIMDTVSVPHGLVIGNNGKPRFTLYTSCINAEAGEYYFTTYSSRRIRFLDMKKAPLDKAELIAYDMTGGEDIKEILAYGKTK